MTYGARQNKRRVARKGVTLPARYSSANVTLDGQVGDVSPEGMFFGTDFLDQPGEIATIYVFLPTRKEPLELRGEVRWVSDAPHSSGMGIFLVGVSLQDRLALSAAADDPETGESAREGNA